jgi:hypothetical protein
VEVPFFILKVDITGGWVRVRDGGFLKSEHPAWIFGWLGAYLIELPDFVSSKLEIRRSEVILGLVEPFRSDDNRGDDRTA